MWKKIINSVNVTQEINLCSMNLTGWWDSIVSSDYGSVCWCWPEKFVWDDSLVYMCLIIGCCSSFFFGIIRTYRQKIKFCCSFIMYSVPNVSKFIDKTVAVDHCCCSISGRILEIDIEFSLYAVCKIVYFEEPVEIEE